jgi:hypothetical protein
MTRKCTAIEWRTEEVQTSFGFREAQIQVDCDAGAVWLCRDRYGRYTLPRCTFHGEAFRQKKPIENA